MKKAENYRDSSKGSPEDVSGKSEFGVQIRVQLATLNILSSFFKNGPKSSNYIVQALKKILDPLLSGFLENYYDRGTELLKEHDALLRGSSRNKRVKISVGKEAIIMPHGSGKTNIADMLEDQLDEAAAANDGSDELDDGEPGDDDELDDGETYDDDEQDDGEPHDDEPHDVLVPDTPSHIQSIMNNPFLKPPAEKIANDGDLNEISLELLKTFQNGDAQQHCEAVDQFWINEHFRKGLCQSILECNYIMSDVSSFAIRYIAEPPGEKLDRIKKDSSFDKVLYEKDHVVKISGILGIIIGYWIKIDMFVELAKELDANDTISPILRS